MNTIGIRVSPTEITFSIFDTVENSIINIEEIAIPNALTVPERLKYIRCNILDVLREYEVKKAGIRLSEPSARSISIERVQIEGVIQEAFSSSVLDEYYYGAISTIAAKNNIDRNRIKPLVKGNENYDAVENWQELSEKEREAVLTAIGAMNA
ncbi:MULTISPECIES: hypothetical protein [unclassified Pseudoalteromonas]|uniref:hypothetical protein n=1 Tax=unclassified Pseudoalteromonas TaxID=194690 RepID=UPI0005AA28FA|nr:MULTISPECIES: hypothetical protein [unclassified Pseudoalteromonas]